MGEGTSGDETTPFCVTFVTGVMPDKWGERWRKRHRSPLELLPVAEDRQLDALRSGTAAMAFVRLPVEREGLHAITLYTEDVVVLVSREHPAAAYEEIPVADLADEHLLQDPDDVPAWRDLATEVRDGSRHPVPALTLTELVESVAAGAGVAFVPRSVARIHHRKDVVSVPVPDLEGRPVALVWPIAADDARVEDFVGVVRGRTERSSRGRDAGKTVEARKASAPRGSSTRGAGRTGARRSGTKGARGKTARGRGRGRG